jgi:hypothetical protein
MQPPFGFWRISVTVALKLGIRAIGELVRVGESAAVARARVMGWTYRCVGMALLASGHHTG